LSSAVAGEDAGAAVFRPRRFKLQFKVNGRDYFLAFVDNEGRWYIFAPTAQSIERIPVYVDAPIYGRAGVVENGHQKVSR
jgi:hypothetical protein